MAPHNDAEKLSITDFVVEKVLDDSSEADMAVDTGGETADVADVHVEAAIDPVTTSNSFTTRSPTVDGTGGRSNEQTEVDAEKRIEDAVDGHTDAAVNHLTTGSIEEELSDDVSEASTMILSNNRNDGANNVNKSQDRTRNKENKEPRLLLSLPDEILLNIFGKAVGAGGNVLIQGTKGDDITNTPNHFVIADHSFGGTYITNYMALRLTKKKVRDLSDEAFWRKNDFEFHDGGAVSSFFDRMQPGPEFLGGIRNITLNVMDRCSHYFLHYLEFAPNLRRLTIHGSSYVYEAGNAQDEFERQCRRKFHKYVQDHVKDLFMPLREARGKGRFEIVFDALCKGRNERFHDLLRRAQWYGGAAGAMPLSLKDIRFRAKLINEEFNSMVVSMENEIHEAENTNEGGDVSEQS
ncbi:uncharacterized protein BDZ99DRAFT_470811 [Mytilinidion resinicola]|uniref:Uncharacterized protein n=1 Tax=Mytilinidion resinicola TaxID=574789 RepID=A0A6A6ZCD4_9PEZI|nr:uncharacterized protein BDZ99DRAFT_470811 [Mytilinidion resinicola]KAF2817867.1 hypothetical protein BDZ99DRAFT_470811 [Mytilinidion resinicola]